MKVMLMPLAIAAIFFKAGMRKLGKYWEAWGLMGMRWDGGR